MSFLFKTTTFPSLVDRGASAEELRNMLDSLPLPRRQEEVLALRRGQVRRLYELVKGNEPVKPEQLVPSSVPAGATVRYLGRNSLPAFNSFEKRMTRTADGIVFGYNFQPVPGAMKVTGPGYFVVSEGDDTHPGELLFDYTQEPPFEPAGWPAYKPNDRGGSRLVFKDMKDYVRRVAEHVVVGAAFKNGVAQDAYFLLVAAYPVPSP